MEDDKKSFEFLKKHVDTVIVLGAILSSVLWINGEFNTVRADIANIKSDMAVIKTVLIMKNILPSEIAKCEKEKQ